MMLLMCSTRLHRRLTQTIKKYTESELGLKIETWTDQSETSFSSEIESFAETNNLNSSSLPTFSNNAKQTSIRTLTGGQFHQLWLRNNSASDEKCKTILKELYSDVQASIDSDKAKALDLNQALKYKSAQAFFDDVNSFVRKYLSHGDAVGPMKTKRLQEFLDRTVAQDAFLVRLGLAKRLGKEGLVSTIDETVTSLKDYMEENVIQPLKGDVQKFGSKLNSEVEKMDNQISVMDKKIDSAGENIERQLNSKLGSIRTEFETLCKQNNEQCDNLNKKMNRSVEEIETSIGSERREREKLKSDMGDDIRRNKLQQEEDLKRVEKVWQRRAMSYQSQ